MCCFALNPLFDKAKPLPGRGWRVGEFRVGRIELTKSGNRPAVGRLLDGVIA